MEAEKAALVGQSPSGNYGDIAYGFFNGMVDVFPEDSLPTLCRDNSTTIWREIDNLFISKNYNLATEDVEFTYAL